MKSKELSNLIHEHNKEYRNKISNMLAAKLGVSCLYTESNLWLEPHFNSFDDIEFTSSNFTISLSRKDHVIIKYQFCREVNTANQKPLKKYDISDHIRGLRQNLDTAELLLRLIIESKDEIFKINNERINADILEIKDASITK